MTTELLRTPEATGADQRAGRILGLRCRACGRPEALGPSYVCAACFGPLEVAYDLDLVRADLSRATIEARPAGIWRYLELLPVAAQPARGLPVGSSPLLRAERLGAAIGIETLLLKDDSRNPT
ncbi:MAG: threonine synthase, partial [Candidatus Limnocylindrales bacterium]